MTVIAFSGLGLDISSEELGQIAASGVRSAMSLAGG